MWPYFPSGVSACFSWTGVFPSSDRGEPCPTATVLRHKRCPCKPQEGRALARLSASFLWYTSEDPWAHAPVRCWASVRQPACAQDHLRLTLRTDATPVYCFSPIFAKLSATASLPPVERWSALPRGASARTVCSNFPSLKRALSLVLPDNFLGLASVTRTGRGRLFYQRVRYTRDF